MNSVISIPEIINHISTFLYPRDIINFSQTCSSVYDCLNLYNQIERAKWVEEWEKYSGNIEAVKYLVSRQDEIGLNDDLLFHASKFDRLEIMKYILSQGGVSRYNNLSYMLDACKYGNLSIVQYLISIGINPKIRKWQFLAKASSSGNLDLVKYLIDIRIHKPGSGFSIEKSTERAAKYGHLQIVKYFIRIRPQGKDRGIVKAAQFGHFPIVKYLYNLGIDRYYRSQALYMAISKFDIFKYLLDRETEINYNNFISYSAMHAPLSTLKYLVDKYSPNQEQKNLALLSSTEKDRSEIIEYLLCIGADASTNDNGPIINASWVGNLSIIKLLIEAGADPNVKGGSPLKFAIERKHLKVVEYLKEKIKNI